MLIKILPGKFGASKFGLPIPLLGHGAYTCTDFLPMPVLDFMPSLCQWLDTHTSTGMCVGHIHNRNTNAIAWTMGCTHLSVTNKNRCIPTSYPNNHIRCTWVLQGLVLIQVLPWVYGASKFGMPIPLLGHGVYTCTDFMPMPVLRMSTSTVNAVLWMSTGTSRFDVQSMPLVRHGHIKTWHPYQY